MDRGIFALYKMNIEYMQKLSEKHIDILQSIITRMASNSTSCKTWCITIISAILIFLTRIQKIEYIFIAIIPLVWFLFLDIYYLSQERGFRNSFNEFIEKLRVDKLDNKILLKIYPTKVCYWSSFNSPSIYFFYPTFLLIILVLFLLLK